MAGGSLHRYLVVAHSVRQALDAGRPVVALETTLVTHGFPAAEGLELAFELEEIVSAVGAIPATIGVMAGQLIVGLTRDQLQALAAEPGVAKLNPANLAAGIASGEAGSTTVAATMIAAHAAGIRVLATGGIGGVHRHAEETGDVSADLTALSRLPIAVVCAGAKAVLDLPRTLEALETLGVPVYGLATERFPAFYRRDSGLPVDRAFAHVRELATAVSVHLSLGLGTGIVVANPIAVGHEMPASQYQPALDQALAEAHHATVRGRDVTPFLLRRLRELTADRSSFSNRALLRGNARVAAEIACDIRHQQGEREP